MSLIRCKSDCMHQNNGYCDLDTQIEVDNIDIHNIECAHYKSCKNNVEIKMPE